MPEEKIVPKVFDVPVENLKSDKVANRLFLQTVADALGLPISDVGVSVVHPENDFSKVLAIRVQIPGDQPIKPALDALKALEVPAEETDQAKAEAENARRQEIEAEALLAFVKQTKGTLADFETRIATLEAVK